MKELWHNPTFKYFLGRSRWYLLTFFVAVAINFVLPRLGGTSPIDTIMAKVGQVLEGEAAKAKEEDYLMKFGLVKTIAVKESTTGAITKKIKRDESGNPLPTSLFEQFIRYVGNTLKGDLGSSIVMPGVKVIDVLKKAIPWTLALQIPTIILAWLVGNILGALAAYKRGYFDKILYPLAQFGSSIPPFAFGMIVVFFLGIKLSLFPSMGAYAMNVVPGFTWEFFSSAAYHYILPFLSIFLILLGGQAIGMRSMCIYELGTDYITYAKRLGIKESKIIFYVFRNAMLPQLTGLALSLGMMVGGAIVTEIIFSYPGLGMAILNAVLTNDYPIIQATTLLVTVTVLVANFTIDILIGFFDPRIKVSQRGA